MPPKSRPNNDAEHDDDDDDNVLQAVVLADSFNNRFKPLTAHRPRCLLPICNAPLLEWTFESLVLAGVREIFVVCRSHADEIQQAILNSKYSLPGSGVSIQPIITAEETIAPGDALRDIYTHGIITSDFVLVSGDLVSSIHIDQAVRAHKQRRLNNKDAIMTMVVKESSSHHRSRPKGDSGLFVLDPSTSECLYYEPVIAQPYKARMSVPREILQSHPEVDIRNDLIDCAIDICSVEVPSLFQDNFDYLDIRRDFVHGILTSDLLKRNIHCFVADEGYATRVKDTKSYAAVSHDILSRWTFPLVPDGNYPGDTKYEYRKGGKYLPRDNSVILSRTSKIGNETMLGSFTRVHEQAVVERSVLGKKVVVGSHTFIARSHILERTQIGSQCRIEDCIVGADVQILNGCTLSRGCILSDGVIIGPNVTLPPFSRVSLSEYDDGNSSEEEGGVNDRGDGQTVAWSPELGKEGKGILWPESSDKSEQGDDVEHFENQQYLRIGASSPELLNVDPGSDSDIGSEEEEESETDAVLSPTSSATSWRPEVRRGKETDRELMSECEQTLARAFAENHSVEDTTLELKGIRMTTNAPLRKVREIVIGFLVEHARGKRGGMVEQRKAATWLVDRWGGLVHGIGSGDGMESIGILQKKCSELEGTAELFAPFLTAFYNADIVDEDDVRGWYGKTKTSGEERTELRKNMDRCRRVGELMIKQFDAQSSSEEEDSE